MNANVLVLGEEKDFKAQNCKASTNCPKEAYSLTQTLIHKAPFKCDLFLGFS